ncbi:MAG TPA: hypothetical protein VIK74_12015, partial [Parasegetibacter sp.]
ELQEYFTARIFSQFEYPEGARNFSLEEFREEYLKNLKAYENHPIYNSYFDYRTIIKEDMESAVQSESSETLLPSELFPDKIAEDLVFYNSLRNDYLNLENISKGAFNIKNFDFNGIKYDVTKATGVLRDVEQQLNEMENMFRGHDKKVMNALYLHAVKQEYSDEWKKKFREFFVLEEKINSDLTEYQEFLSAATFMHETHPFEIIHRKMAKLKEMEAPIKQKMIDVLHSDAYRKFILTDERMLLEKFTGCEWTYFIEPDYYDEYVTLMYQSMNTYAQILVRKISMERKQLLDWQASFLTGPLNHAVSEEWRTTIPASS